MPGAQKRLGELNALMAADNFWNNREQAQKLIDEANTLRNKTEPLAKPSAGLDWAWEPGPPEICFVITGLQSSRICSA